MLFNVSYSWNIINGFPLPRKKIPNVYNDIQILRTVGTNISIQWNCPCILSPSETRTWFLHMPCILILFVISCIVVSIWNVFLYPFLLIEMLLIYFSRTRYGNLSRCHKAIRYYLYTSLYFYVIGHHRDSQWCLSLRHRTFSPPSL